MRKVYLSVCALASLTASAQFTIDFDNMSTGDVSPQSTHIELWPPGTGTDAQVSGTEYYSSPYSMLLRDNNTDDVVVNLGNKNADLWVVEWWMYVPTGNTGYWNIQENEDATPSQWNGEYLVGATGSGGSAGVITHNNTASTVSFPHDTWFLVEIFVDLDNGLISVYVDGDDLLEDEAYEDNNGIAGQQLGAINFYSIDTNNTYYVDDFELYKGCRQPDNLMLDNVDINEAEFSWDASPDEMDGYNWAVMAIGEHPEGDTPVASGAVATGVLTDIATGLDAETDYDLYVQTDCDTDGLSNWAGPLGFQTLEACPPPSDIDVDNVTGTTADISWEASSAESDGYNWAVMNSGEHPDNDTPVVDGTTSPGVTMASVTGLFPETLYHVYVQSDCGTEGVSSWGGPGTLLTSQFTCEIPVASSTDVEGTAVTVNWTEPDPAPEDGYYWELFYGSDDPETDPALDSDSVAPGETSTEISGLDEQTAYQLLLYSLCVETTTPPIMSNPVTLNFTSGMTVGTDDSPIPGFAVYPNPAERFVYFGADTPIDKVSIYTLTGQRVLKSETDKGKIDLSGLTPGLYLMKVESGGQTGIYRVLKK